MQANSEIPSFHWADYLVFSLSLAVSLSVGLFFCIQDKKKKPNSDEFLIGQGKMNPMSVGLSLCASLLNGVFLIGGPAEVYYQGTIYALVGISIFLLGFSVTLIIIPIFRNIKMTSSYKYLGVRFNSMAVQVAAAIVFTLSIVLFLAVVLYAPSLAFSQVTGFNIHLIQVICGLVCTMYVFLGGIKAVVWTDALQMVIIFVGTIVVAILAVVEVGGAGKVWHLVLRDNRINFNILSPDPRTLYTLWTQMIVQIFVWVPVFGSNQMIIQRYLAVSSTRDAQIAVWVCIAVALVILAIITVCGLAMYAYFVDCDPVISQRVSKADQIFPLLLMEVLGQYRGLPELYTAAVFAAALSSVSSAVNSLAAVFLEDFIKPLYKKCKVKDITEKTATLTSRGLCLLFGLLTIGLSYVAPHMGNAIIRMTTSIWGMTGGPLFGLFVLAMFFPCSNAVGSITGLVVSLVFSFWLGVGGILHGERTPPLKPLGHRCCLQNNASTPYNNMTTLSAGNDQSLLALDCPSLSAVPQPEEKNVLVDFYSISYCWYGFINLIICVLVGLVASLLVDCNKHDCTDRGADVNPDLVYDCGTKCFCYCPSKVQELCQCGVDHESSSVKYKAESGHANAAFSTDEKYAEQTKL